VPCYNEVVKLKRIFYDFFVVVFLPLLTYTALLIAISPDATVASSGAIGAMIFGIIISIFLALQKNEHSRMTDTHYAGALIFLLALFTVFSAYFFKPRPLHE
jgi:predicted MFS family arabinose efflux permease